jgi:hypothetical protein
MHALLRRIDGVLLNAAQQCLLIWQTRLKLPETVSSVENTSGATVFHSEPQISIPTQPSLSSHHEMDLDDNQRQITSSAMSIVADSEPACAEGAGSTAEPEDTAIINQLKKRGIGKYYCQYGLSCRKGGVTSSGTMKEFTRNSDFRYVHGVPR